MNADLIIKNAWVFQTPTRSFIKQNVAIKDNKFYYISPADIDYLSTNVIEAENQYLIPGLIDIHMHIESSMTTPTIFSEAVLRYGVTTIVADAHEMANVFGLDGLKEFMAADTTLDIFHAIPSSVPSTTPELETTGGVIGLAEVAKLLQDPRVICLGEAMNFKGIAYETDSLIAQIIDLCKKERPTMPMEGHIPKIYDQELADFLYSGISSDHTHQFPEQLLAKINAGLFIQFQNKSITPENMMVIHDNQLYDFACFITDDVMADDLLSGHLNANLLKAVQAGLPMEEAIYMTTYTPARRMSLLDRGMIAPGRIADFILLDDLAEFSINAVYKDGHPVYTKGEAIHYPEVIEEFPAEYFQSVHCRPLTPQDLRLAVKTDKEFVRCNVIQKQVVGTFTERVTRTIPVTNGILQIQEANIAQLIVMERYGKNGNIAHALMDQPLKKKGAIATTWAHDHHNLMVMGNDADSILLAQHELLKLQGGYVVVHDGQVVATCPLPIGGILSQAPIEELGADLKHVRQAMQNLGYENMNEIMSFSTLSLPVSPAIKVTDKGMMDTKSQTFYPLIFPEDGVLLHASID
ncbi:adenine deaminase C-terminal domain-containing protein [Candidatus Enterococcus willemsii]|uniref:Adenine deaminase n=1 Tax=Candidatus Enterococcus willemsii TaxID=1857215 RepID=A0ABQ6Z004_9ENTE|nr:adenine deaminase C-terminal domain-containing protein [Enterococcus sp. CU12B]KAF1304269.1 adenosine deaminase [Enterococcus sp. CU12B]